MFRHESRLTGDMRDWGNGAFDNQEETTDGISSQPLIQLECSSCHAIFEAIVFRDVVSQAMNMENHRDGEGCTPPTLQNAANFRLKKIDS
jgi:hypothetical protein